MSHSIVFHSEDLQDRSESRWDIPLAYSQGEMNAWYPGNGKISAKDAKHLLSVMFSEIDNASSLLAVQWPEDLDAAETWAANVASHLARAYAIARALEERGDRESAESAVWVQSQINGKHDDSEWRIAEIEGAAL